MYIICIIFSVKWSRLPTVLYEHLKDQNRIFSLKSMSNSFIFPFFHLAETSLRNSVNSGDTYHLYRRMKNVSIGIFSQFAAFSPRIAG